MADNPAGLRYEVRLRSGKHCYINGISLRNSHINCSFSLPYKLEHLDQVSGSSYKVLGAIWIGIFAVSAVQTY